MVKKLLPLLIFMLLLTGCGQQPRITKSTPPADLSNISFADIKIGDDLRDIDLSQFHNDNGNQFWTYSFDEVYIKADENGVVTRLQTAEECGLWADAPTANRVKALFGESASYWFDREQRLKAFSYADRAAKLALTVVYAENSDDIVWAIVERIGFPP